MFWILNFIFSYTVSLFFGVIFDVPKRLYNTVGIVGACGWMVYTIFFDGLNTHTIYSSFFGSLALGCLSHIMARSKKEPVIIFMIPGIIPLVPGSLAYKAMQQLVTLNFTEANNTFIRTILIAGSIALGLLLSDQLSKTLNIKKYWKVKRNRL